MCCDMAFLPHWEALRTILYVYMCIAAVIPSDVCQVQIDVVQQPMDTTACVGSTASFTCVIFFSSGSSVEPVWLRNDVDLDLTRHIIISNRTGSNTPVYISSTVTISNITIADDGAQYQCSILTLSSKATLNVAAAPPISITVNETCSNDFTVSWTTTSDGIGSSYNVTLSPPSSILTTMDNSYNFTGLIPNTDYNVTIRAIQCLGAPTTMMITTSTRKAAVPSSVLYLYSISITNATITVEWDPVESFNCGPILYYNVTIATIRNISGPTDRTFGFFNLMSNTSYIISVAAVNRAVFHQMSCQAVLHGDHNCSLHRDGTAYFFCPTCFPYNAVVCTSVCNGTGPASTITVTTLTNEEKATRPTTAPTVCSSENDASLSTGLVAIIAALSSSAISVVLTAIITFVMTAYYYKRKYSYKPTMVTQPVVSKTDVVEYEITKTSPDNMAMTTNPSYDVAMSSNPAYGHNVKKIDQVSDYYS